MTAAACPKNAAKENLSGSHLAFGGNTSTFVPRATKPAQNAATPHPSKNAKNDGATRSTNQDTIAKTGAATIATLGNNASAAPIATNTMRNEKPVPSMSVALVPPRPNKRNGNAKAVTT
mmetsp:Transcript_26376/g.33746  ORF Transcript_26376/g.33746 Transcript_26376/m.33746 type:complete len:119 (+) Transcript_26376:461-817(+)